MIFPEESKPSPRSGKAGLSRLIQDLEDGVITREDRHALMEILRTSSEARELYMKHIKLTALLRQTAETRGELGTIPVSQEMLRRATRKSARTAIAWGIAAVLFVALGLMLFQVKLESPSPEIDWDVSRDASYEIKRGHSEEERTGGDQLRPGDRVVIERGLLQMKFPSEVEAIIEGPSEFTVVSESEIRLDGGMSWFRVPPEGIGFTVETKAAKVIDLGTEFGLSFVGNDALQIHVGKGRVRVEPDVTGSAEFEISEGGAIRLGRKGETEKIVVRPEFFRRKFTRQMPYLHWSFDIRSGNKFPASGIIPGAAGYGAILQLPGGGEASEAELTGCQTEGIRGRALSLNGKFFAETAFPGIGGNAPRTVAAWVRHRGSPLRFPQPGAHHPLDDPYPGYGATTKFGEQAFLIDYGNSGITTAAGALGEVLEPDTSYTLDFHVAARPGVHSATYRVELVAFGEGEGDKSRRNHSRNRPGTVLAYAEGEAVAHDMSEHDRITLKVAADHPAIGKELAIRLVHRGKLVQSGGRTRHSGRVLYDNLRLSKKTGGDSRLILSEGFETPEVAGFAVGTLPKTGWIGSSRSLGIFNQRPPFRTPFVSWGAPEPGRMWAGFVEDIPALASATAIRHAWSREEAPGQIRSGDWVHLATVYTGQLNSANQPEIIHFVNGKHVASHSAAPGTSGSLDTEVDPTLASPLRFGALPGTVTNGAVLDGDIDEFFIFRGILDEAEIGRLMENNSPHFLKK